MNQTTVILILPTMLTKSGLIFDVTILTLVFVITLFTSEIIRLKNCDTVLSNSIRDHIR
jgi:hypothetical protein